jgi:hypothetical protein
MTPNQKRLVTVIISGLFLLIAVYFEGDGFEIHRFIVGLFGITEGILFVIGLERFDKFATINKWTDGQKLVRKALFCFGLIAIMVTADRLINSTLTTYNRDYKIIWTIIIPGSIVTAQLFKLLDFWAIDNEKKDQSRKDIEYNCQQKLIASGRDKCVIAVCNSCFNFITLERAKLFDCPPAFS